jgi:F-type H+-transporting ATPase subunit epsilon
VAIPATFELQILTPERLLVKTQVDEAVIPGTEGYFGVLPGHTPMLAALSIGELWYRIGQEKTFLAIAYGFCEVLPDRVTVLARIAERAEDIDPARAEEARKRAEARLQQMKDIDFERARMALEKALTRLQASSRVPAGRIGHRRMPPPQA